MSGPIASTRATPGNAVSASRIAAGSGAAARSTSTRTKRVVATGTPAELRERVPLELYRAWGDDARAIAAAARALPYVAGARATGIAARIEVCREGSPGAERVLRDLDRLAGGVRFAEHLPIDMETTLLALAGEA